jgi:hypothetical protein
LLLVTLLALPVTLTYQLSFKEKLSADVRLNWAFGLVNADVSPDPANPESDEAESARKKAGWRSKAKGDKTKFVAAIREPAFRRRILRFAADVWRAIHKKNIELLVRVGLGDPADTGQLWGVVGPLSGALARAGDIRVTIEPDFLDATFEVDGSGTMRMIPLQVVIIVLGLLVSPPFWRGIMLLRTPG